MKIVRVFLAVIVVLGAGLSMKPEAKRVVAQVQICCSNPPPCPPYCAVPEQPK